jgi:hypothetical protein
MKAFTLVNPSVCQFGKLEVTSTPEESSFFRALALAVKIVNWTSSYSEFRHTSKNFERGFPKHILEKNTVF